MPDTLPSAANQVAVKRYDINLTLHDILTPLTQIGSSATPELDQHLVQLRDLAGSLKGVVERIDGIDATVLAPTSR